MPYDPIMVEPMRRELADAGAVELRTPEDVDAFMAEGGDPALLVVNSVCGCAAGSARPGVRLALDHPQRPGRVATVFAGQDVEATARARSHFPDLDPSSPSFILIAGGKAVEYIPRRMIEGRDPGAVRELLAAAFERHLAGRPAG